MAATPFFFGKAHLNTLREATVAQAPRAHFDPRRSEDLFFCPEVKAAVEVFLCQMLGDRSSFLCLILPPSPSVIALFLSASGAGRWREEGRGGGGQNLKLYSGTPVVERRGGGKKAEN